MSSERDIRAIQAIKGIPAILRAIAEMSGLGFICVGKITQSEFIACAVLDQIGFGLPVGGRVDVRTTLCEQVRDTRQSIVIDQASSDARYCKHPTPLMYGFESYISVPLTRSDGEFFGTLCAFDSRPVAVSATSTLKSMTLFAELISLQLEAEEKYDRGQEALLQERLDSDLREQFIGVLGHDLRTPLQAICLGMQLALRMENEPKLERILESALRSGNRISALVDDLMDFAHGRLGTGLQLNFEHTTTLETTLLQVVDELQTNFLGRQIEKDIRIDAAVFCSPGRIAQLLSNLLVNALKYGDPQQPVHVTAHLARQNLNIQVSNAGTPIAPETQSRLFQPYWRGESSKKSDGLGLGLYIASEIAKSHRGLLTVSSNPQRTLFSFSCPMYAVDA